MPTNVNQLHEAKLSAGDRIADSVADTMGSWRFIIAQTVMIILWMLWNS